MDKKEQELERSNLAASYQKAIILSLLNKVENVLKIQKLKLLLLQEELQQILILEKRPKNSKINLI